MRRTTVFLTSLFLLLAAAETAHANGILVASEPGPTAPTARDARPRGPVRLRSHEVKARLHDRVALVTVEQVFHNDSARQLEGTYLFPLPPGAIVSKFAMTMGGKMVEGEILDAEEARRIYHGIVRRRRDPGLLEYVGRGLFRARVFPIPPRGDVTVRIGFQQVLAEDEGTLEFRYPLATNRFHTAPVEHVRVDVELTSGVDVKGVYSPSHDFDLTRVGERRVQARLDRKSAHQTRDVLLYVARSPEAVGFSTLSNKRAGEDGTFMAVLAPRNHLEDVERVPKDVTYVLDTSGSMAGTKLVQAKAALRHGVETLHPGDRFNVVAFSSAARTFRDAPVAVGGETREAARAWIDGLEAKGGTNILEALLTALRRPRGDRLALVVFITDGRPTIGERLTNPLVKAVAGANEGGARVFTFGVGHDLDVNLLDRLAEVTRGTRDYVAPEEDIEIVTSRFFRKVNRPAMSDLVLDLGPGVYDVYPKRLPDLFAGQQVVVYGRYKEAGARTITLRGRLGKRAVVKRYEARFTKKEAADFLPRLWAHRKLAFLLDDVRLHGAQQEVIEEIVRLATRHAIVTPYTAGLVVEESEIPPARVATHNPLFVVGGRRLDDRPASRRRYRGPLSAIPPNQRAPTDPTPPAPPPTTGPPIPLPPTAPTPTTPGMRAPATPTPSSPTVSKDLRERKRAARHDGADGRPDKIVRVAGKSFVLRGGRWLDTAWDGKGETVKVTLFGEAYFALIEQDRRVARYLSVGKRVVFVLDGKVYEVVPAAEPGK